MLILYLSFIKNAVERKLYPLKKVIDELKEDIVLVTSEGRLKPSSAVIHFHSKYKPQCDLTVKFPGIKCYNTLKIFCHFLTFCFAAKIKCFSWGLLTN